MSRTNALGWASLMGAFASSDSPRINPAKLLPFPALAGVSEEEPVKRMISVATCDIAVKLASEGIICYPMLAAIQQIPEIESALDSMN